MLLDVLCKVGFCISLMKWKMSFNLRVNVFDVFTHFKIELILKLFFNEFVRGPLLFYNWWSAILFAVVGSSLFAHHQPCMKCPAAVVIHCVPLRNWILNIAEWIYTIFVIHFVSLMTDYPLLLPFFKLYFESE